MLRRRAAPGAYPGDTRTPQDTYALRQPPTISILNRTKAPMQAFMPVWTLFVVPGTFSPWAAAPRRPSFWKEHPPEQNERSAA